MVVLVLRPETSLKKSAGANEEKEIIFLREKHLLTKVFSQQYVDCIPPAVASGDRRLEENSTQSILSNPIYSFNPINNSVLPNSLYSILSEYFTTHHFTHSTPN